VIISLRDPQYQSHCSNPPIGGQALPCPAPPGSSQVKFSQFQGVWGYGGGGNAGIKIYNLIIVFEFYNKEKKEKKKRAL